LPTPVSRIPRVCLSLLAFCFMILAPLACHAQKVVVQNAGGGRKLELVYDASGQVVETRTLAPDGTLESRDSVEKKPGFFVPQTTDISYWPGGTKVRNFSHTEFDQNANFTSEVVETYDEAGKHTAGHKIVHDPPTGAYQCWDWDGSAQTYKSIKCPAGAESGERPEDFRRITRAQAMESLGRAREKAASERKSHSVSLGRPTVPGATRNVPVGIVLPLLLVPGERVSGSVVQEFEPFEDRPDLSLIRFTIPVDSSAEATPLRGWVVEVAGSMPEPADSPFSFVVPRGTARLTVALRQVGHPGQSLSQAVPVTNKLAQTAPSGDFEAPVVVAKESVFEVHGSFSGNSTQAFASITDEPAAIVAETRHVAFIRVPDQASEGQQNLIFSEGSTLVAIPVVVAELSFLPEPESVKAGESRLFISRLAGVNQLPEKYWRAGIFPASSIEWSRRLVPGFMPPGEEKPTERNKSQAGSGEDKQEKKKSGGHDEEAAQSQRGTLLVVIQNATPETASLRNSNDQRFTFTLTADSFSQGEFVYKFVVTGLQSSEFGLDVAIVPFLAPSISQPFTN